MLKILLKLWWIQKQRTFDWKRMGIFIYMVWVQAIGRQEASWVSSSRRVEWRLSSFHLS